MREILRGFLLGVLFLLVVAIFFFGVAIPEIAGKLLIKLSEWSQDKLYYFVGDSINRLAPPEA